MSKFCKSCGNRLNIEKEIEEATGGELSICLDCVNKATATILKKWLDEVNDAKVRQELGERLADINGLC